jgi:hypothetical protein
MTVLLFHAGRDEPFIFASRSPGMKLEDGG